MSATLVSFLYDIRQRYLFYSNIALFTTGMFGNLSNILVFATLRYFRGNQCAFCFIMESVSNIGLLLISYPSYFYQYHTGIDLTRTSLVWCKLRSGLSDIFGMCSLFIICFQTFDQFMVTNPRPNYRRISSLKLARRFLFGNVCFVVLHTIPFIMLAKKRSSGLCTIANTGLNIYNTFFYYPILSCALPISITVTFSLLAYRNVRRIVRWQIPMVRRRLDRQLTAMVLARVVSLILLGLPYIAYQLYRLNLHVTDSDQLTIAISSLASAIATSVLYLNFATTFYLFLAVSARFRRQVKQDMGKKCWACWTGLYRWGNINRNRNQVAPKTVRQIVVDVPSD